MLTFLTSMKAFDGSASEIQFRSLVNWRRLFPESQIVVFGKTQGAESVCKSVSACYVPEIESTESGTPYFGAIARWANQYAKYDLCVYLNGDILLGQDFKKICQVEYDNLIAVSKDGNYLFVGQRIDIDGKYINERGKEDDFSSEREVRGKIHPPAGMDYFVFKRGMFCDIEPLIVGRGGYDSAIVTYCLRNKIPVIDASPAFFVYHQWHDYGHVAGGKQTAHRGEEAKMNFAHHGLRGFAPHCVDANWMLTKDGQILPNKRRSWMRRLEFELYYKRGFKWCPPLNQIWNILNRGAPSVPN
jgi:hypothetical protein